VKIIPSALRSAPLPVEEVTPGFPSLLHSTASGTGILLGPEAATALMSGDAKELATTTGASQVAGSYEYPADGRRPGLAYAALSPTIINGAYDECWVDAWPVNPRISSLLFATITPNAPTTADSPQVSQLNSSLGTQFDGRAEFQSRVTRWAALFAAAGGMALGFASIRTRRLQMASALHAGVSRHALGLQVWFETSAWTVSASAIALAIVAALARQTGQGSDGSWLFTGGSVMTSSCLGVACGVAIAIAVTRESQLFRYFKDR
jgi:hypothetical protein